MIAFQHPEPYQIIVRFAGYSLHHFRAVAEHPRPFDLTVATIQRIVAEHFRMPLREMWSERRAREVARPRQIAMYLCRKHTRRSLPDIGRRFGNRDHTTVMHACRQIERLRTEDIEVANHVTVLSRVLDDA